MRRLAVIVGIAAAIAAAALAMSVVILAGDGFSARRAPLPMEASIARALRRWTLPAKLRGARNPVPLSPQVLREARDHFADHCALCHANDGSGDAEIAHGLYPPVPDLRKEATQSLSDGELLHAIHDGVAFTGMPAWGEGDAANDLDSWKLVHFIRHLPQVTAQDLAEMEALNPRSPAEQREEEETRRFLEGGEAPAGESGAPHSHHH
jgi:mono/diheme cytochrome c family protein